MCDEAYSVYVADLPIQHLHITPPNIDHIHASMRKTEIFEFAHIQKYERVLFLDCDIVISAPLTPIFDSIQRKDLLYVVYEHTDIDMHLNLHYHRRDQPYNDETLASFREKGIYVFNAGQYGFLTSDSMKEHFDQVCKDKKCYHPDFHFYEQSFMNNHFNRNFAVSYDIHPFVRLYADENPYDNIIIHHFCGCGTPFKDKLTKMRALVLLINK